jgi:hypothetical protein
MLGCWVWVGSLSVPPTVEGAAVGQTPLQQAELGPEAGGPHWPRHTGSSSSSRGAAAEECEHCDFAAQRGVWTCKQQQTADTAHVPGFVT